MVLSMLSMVHLFANDKNRTSDHEANQPVPLSPPLSPNFFQLSQELAFSWRQQQPEENNGIRKFCLEEIPTLLEDKNIPALVSIDDEKAIEEASEMKTEEPSVAPVNCIIAPVVALAEDAESSVHLNSSEDEDDVPPPPPPAESELMSPASPRIRKTMVTSDPAMNQRVLPTVTYDVTRKVFKKTVWVNEDANCYYECPQSSLLASIFEDEQLKSELWYTEKEQEYFRYQYETARHELLRAFPPPHQHAAKMLVENWRQVISNVYRSSITAAFRSFNTRTRVNSTSSPKRAKQQMHRRERGNLRYSGGDNRVHHQHHNPLNQDDVASIFLEEDALMTLSLLYTQTHDLLVGIEAHLLTPHCRMEREIRKRNLATAVYHLQPYSSLTMPSSASVSYKSSRHNNNEGDDEEVEESRSECYSPYGNIRISRKYSRPSQYFAQQIAQALAASLQEERNNMMMLNSAMRSNSDGSLSSV